MFLCNEKKQQSEFVIFSEAPLKEYLFIGSRDSTEHNVLALYVSPHMEFPVQMMPRSLPGVIP